MIATIILALGIAAAVFLGLKSFVKGKGSCGDCACSCPIKDEMKKPGHEKIQERSPSNLVWRVLCILHKCYNRNRRSGKGEKECG